MKQGIYYCHHHEAHYVKLCGEMRYTDAVKFHELSQHTRHDMVSDLFIDMSETTFIDSTLLGAVTQLGLQFHRRGHKPSLACQNEYIRHTIQTMGLDQLFRWGTMPKADMTWQIMSGEENSLTSSDVLDAHQSLISVDEKNKEEFGELVEQLNNQGKREHE